MNMQAQGPPDRYHDLRLFAIVNTDPRTNNPYGDWPKMAPQLPDLRVTRCTVELALGKIANALARSRAGA